MKRILPPASSPWFDVTARAAVTPDREGTPTIGGG
jgi:hypothetical protein